MAAAPGLVLALAAAAATAAAQQVDREPGAETGEPGRAVIRVTIPEVAPPAGAVSDAAAAPSEAALEALLPAEAAMVVLDAAGGRLVRQHGEHPLRLHGEQAARRLPPCSTFKIPNTLIALGAGAVTPDDHFMPRDPERDPRQEFWSDAWDADQDLPSALRRSTVWYYQELARRVGSEEMQRQLDRLGYGNRDVSGGVDRFWLGGALAISADEQVDFLRRLHAGDFGFPEEHLALLREGTLQEEGEAAGGRYALYAKTGACPIGDGGGGPWVGWWVGWIDRPAGAAFFALNVTGASYQDIAPRRIPLARAVLGELGLLPPPG